MKLAHSQVKSLRTLSWKTRASQLSAQENPSNLVKHQVQKPLSLVMQPQGPAKTV